MSAPAPPPPRDLPVARRSGDPTRGLIRRVLLVCLLFGAVSGAAVAVLRWDDVLLRAASPVLLVVVLLFAWLVLFGVTDDFTARYADLADDGLRSAQSTAPALYAVTNVDGRIYLTAK